MTALHRVILDTDIGSDVDDLMALAQIMGTPKLDLIGVTTVYGDTQLRARLTQRIFTSLGRRVPIHAGEKATMSGREIWWAGHEGVLHENLETESYDSDEAVRYLVETVTASPGEIDVIAIGPLTNIARAIEADSNFASAIRHLWIMGGSFGDQEPEHNLRSDEVAARIVFGAGIPTTVTGLEITRKIHIGSDALDRMKAAGELGEIVVAEIDQWWKFWDAAWNVPHDPVTVLTLTQPELFEFSELGTIVLPEDAETGVSNFVVGEGRTRVTTGLDADAVGLAIIDGIIAASLAGVAANKA